MKIPIIIGSILCLILCSAAADARKLNTELCDKTQIKFDDGDSFFCGEEEVRVLGIDTPETKHPEHGFFTDQPMGTVATSFTNSLLKKAKRITIVRGGRDKYKRTLAHVLIDGELLSVKLIKVGLAYEDVSRYGDSGMREFALQITEAAKVSPKPPFEDPHVWRKKNKKKPVKAEVE